MRNITAPMLAALTANPVRPAFLAQLTFTTGVQYVWTGAGSLVWNGNTYLGVGSLGKIGAITEGTEVKADGTTVALSGIDPALLADCLSEIQVGSPASIYFALVDPNLNILGTPYPLFAGCVDQPVLEIGLDSISIALKLESRLSNLQRASMRRYTSADQALQYADDSFFAFVEQLNDEALVWSA
jgi:hypothetical protein